MNKANSKFTFLPDGSRFMADTNGGLLRVQKCRPLNGQLRSAGCYVDANTDFLCYSHPSGFQVTCPFKCWTENSDDIDTIAIKGTKTLREFGWVYVMANRSMPGLVKVGRTSRHPKHRVGELSKHTNCPEEFELKWSAWTWHPREVERLAHVALDASRVSTNREFFKSSELEAEESITKAMDAVLHRSFIAEVVEKDVDRVSILGGYGADYDDDNDEGYYRNLKWTIHDCDIEISMSAVVALEDDDIEVVSVPTGWRDTTRKYRSILIPI